MKYKVVYRGEILADADKQAAMMLLSQFVQDSEVEEGEQQEMVLKEGLSIQEAQEIIRLLKEKGIIAYMDVEETEWSLELAEKPKEEAAEEAQKESANAEKKAPVPEKNEEKPPAKPVKADPPKKAENKSKESADAPEAGETVIPARKKKKVAASPSSSAPIKAAVAVIILLLLAGGAYFFWASDQEPPAPPPKPPVAKQPSPAPKPVAPPTQPEPMEEEFLLEEELDDFELQAADPEAEEIAQAIAALEQQNTDELDQARQKTVLEKFAAGDIQAGLHELEQIQNERIHDQTVLQLLQQDERIESLGHLADVLVRSCTTPEYQIQAMILLARYKQKQDPDSIESGQLFIAARQKISNLPDEKKQIELYSFLARHTTLTGDIKKGRLLFSIAEDLAALLPTEAEQKKYQKIIEKNKHGLELMLSGATE